MRVAALYNPNLPNSHYRCLVPLKALEERGHTIVWPSTGSARDRIGRLLSGDVVFLYRQYGPATRAVVAVLAKADIPICFDLDDDLASVPEESPHHRAFSGSRGRRIQASIQDVIRSATLCTTPSSYLGEMMRGWGAQRVEVVANYLPRAFLEQRRRAHDGVVVGWIAGLTHAADAARLEIASVLRRLLDTNPVVSVATIGLDLELRHPRYHSLARVPFDKLIDAAAAFDIGIAPLADIAFNRARSDVKLREYGALGIPWLASPVGPYVGYGDAQGGELVPDGDWLPVLSRLVNDASERARRGARARAWSETQSIERGAAHWEETLERAISRARTPASKRRRWRWRSPSPR